MLERLTDPPRPRIPPPLRWLAAACTYAVAMETAPPAQINVATLTALVCWTAVSYVRWRRTRRGHGRPSTY